MSHVTPMNVSYQLNLRQCNNHCNTLQHAATRCNTLQHTDTAFLITQYTQMSHVAHMDESCHTPSVSATNSATHCNTLQHTATHWQCLPCHASHDTHYHLLGYTYGWIMSHRWIQRAKRLQIVQHTLQHTTIHCNTLRHKDRALSLSCITRFV